LDISSQEISASLQSGGVRTAACPDTDLNGWVNSLDPGLVMRNLGDAGRNSGATLDAGIDAEQDTIPITDQATLATGQIVAIDNEHMLIMGFDPGPPLTMTVQRDLYPGTRPNARPHSNGTRIFVALSDGNYDGKNGYTDPRDTDDNSVVNALDYGTVWGMLDSWCP
jgi:hypothetical protein